MTTSKQQRFVEEYLIDLNGAAAYIRAGYKVKNGDVAAICASQLLRNPKVQEALGKAIEARSKRTEITQDKTLADLEAVKADAMQPRKDGQGMLNHSAALKAIELEMKHQGMLVARVEQETKIKYPSSLNDFYGSDDD